MDASHGILNAYLCSVTGSFNVCLHTCMSVPSVLLHLLLSIDFCVMVPVSIIHYFILDRLQ